MACRATIHVERLNSRATNSVEVASAGDAVVAVTFMVRLRVQVVGPQA
jgi:hypothetical protein